MDIVSYVMGQRSVESGGGGTGGGLIVTFNGDTGYTNQTWTEIKTALLAEQTVYLDDGYDFLAFAAANGLHDDDTSKISIYFGNAHLAIDSETGCLYFAD